MYDDDKDNYMLGIIMEQYSLKVGLKIFGVKGKKSITDELSQLHDMKTLFPVDPKTNTMEERTKAITSFMFLKENRDVRVKGRACANGRNQRTHINKVDMTSPTV